MAEAERSRNAAGAGAPVSAPQGEVRRYYPAYERWLVHEAGVRAPKVQVIGFREEEESLLAADGEKGGGGGSGSGASRHGDQFHHVQPARYNFGGRTKNRPGARQHRGLYATGRIEPGEVIMRIPGGALIGEDVLKARGGRYLEDREARAARNGGGGGATEDETEEDAAFAEDGDAGRRRPMERTLMALIEGVRRFASSPDAQAGGAGAHRWKDDDGVALFLIGCREILELMPLPQGDTSCGGSIMPSASPPRPGKKGTKAAAAAYDEISFLPHVSVLPTAFPTNRLYYTPEELDRMGGEIRTDGVTPRRTDVLQGVEADWHGLRDMIKAFYRTYDADGMDAWRCPECRQKEPDGDAPAAAGVECCGRGGCFVLDPDADLNLDAYKWALSNIYSRSCDFSYEGGTSAQQGGDAVRRVIVPLLDMCNHDFGSPVRHDMDADGNITVYNGPKTIQAGGEVCLNYGDFPNQKLLLCYGFFFFFGSQ